MRSAVLFALLLTPSTVLGLLDVKLKAKGKKYFGSAADPNTISESNVKTILTSDYGAVTPENSMKWDATEGEQKPLRAWEAASSSGRIHAASRGAFTFTNADALVSFATSNDRLIRGHTLGECNGLLHVLRRVPIESSSLALSAAVLGTCIFP